MVHAKDGDYMEVELFGKAVLFSNYRIDSASVPDGLYCYDLRGSDDDPGMPIIVEPLVVVNHAGTVLTVEPIEFKLGQLRRRLDEDDGLNFTGSSIALKDFCNKYGVAYSETKYALRPASLEEAGLFYAMPPEKDAELGCIGHVRIDFGHGGKEFWHTWHPRGPEELNSPEFKTELQEVVDEMRHTVLSDMVGMWRFCADNGGYIDGGWAPNYGYIAETEKYRYCLRCVPVQGDYNAYLTCFDKQVQEMNREIRSAREDFSQWLKITESSRHRWVEDAITRLNGKGALYYTGGEDGSYIRIAPDGTLEAGSYEGAYPHIGEAIFQPELRMDCGTFDNAFEKGMKLGGTQFLIDMFSADPPSEPEMDEQSQNYISGPEMSM